MKLIFLDAKTIGDDISLDSYEDFGEVIKYDFSTPDLARKRSVDADILIVNKVPVNKYTIGNAKNLKLVCVTATGTNNLDKDYLDKRGIAWRNVAGYSTDSVTQHTFAIFFYLFEKLRYYDDYVKEGRYTNDTVFTHFAEHFYELKGKTWGIIGLGEIGRSVYRVAEAFGCRMIYASPSGRDPQEGYNMTSMENLLRTSDIISIHTPLNEYTENLINRKTLSMMKKSCILINVARGPIVNEEDLRWALENDVIAAAGLDVLCEEPMSADNPLLEIKDSKKLFITPHIAWASYEARVRLMDIIHSQIKEFLES